MAVGSFGHTGEDGIRQELKFCENGEIVVSSPWQLAIRQSLWIFHNSNISVYQSDFSGPLLTTQAFRAHAEENGVKSSVNSPCVAVLGIIIAIMFSCPWYASTGNTSVGWARTAAAWPCWVDKATG